MGIPVDYETLQTNHPFHYQIYSKINGEVSKYSPPCCIQVSYALNMADAPIERGDYFVPEMGRYSRFASDAKGRLYLIEVCDMGAYLNQYGTAENYKGTTEQMKSRIAGRQGILRFGAAHIDLWDGKRFHQEGGPSMPDSWAAGQPPVVVWTRPSVLSTGIFFWEATGKAAANTHATLTPDWLKGWWKVWDGNTYYYYFGTGGTVMYTKTKPSNTNDRPIRPANTGAFTFAGSQMVIDWKWISGAEMACRETFYNAAPGCRQMNATSNMYSPLVATRNLG
jgi:Type VI secretion system (T6SS), amidase effector protein 4